MTAMPPTLSRQLLVYLSLLLACPAGAQDTPAEGDDKPAEQAGGEPGQATPQAPSGQSAVPDEPTEVETNVRIIVDDRAAELKAAQQEAENEGKATEADYVIDEQLQGEDGKENAPRFSRKRQAGVRLGIAIPYMLGLRYKGGAADCELDQGDDDQFCARSLPVSLDADFSYGVGHKLELLVAARIGLGDDELVANMPLAFSFGLRSYTSAKSFVKTFLGVRVVADYTTDKTGLHDNWKDLDLGVRGDVGLQIDILRYLGFYVQGGVQVMVLRALGIHVGAGAGVQARFP